MNGIRQLIRWGILALSLAATMLFFVAFFEQLPIKETSLALDWKGLWHSIEGGNAKYTETGNLRIPPWSVIPLLPLGLLSMRASWGMLVCINMVALVASVPRVDRKWLTWISIFLLVTSFPSLRTSVDGNIEGPIVLGVYLIIHGYLKEKPYLVAAGVLVATMKVQEVSLLVIVLGIYVLQTWPRHAWLKMGLTVLAVVTVTMLWRGGDWIATVFGTNYQRYTGSIIDIGVIAALNRPGTVPFPIIGLVWMGILGVTLFVSWKSERTLSREKAGMLIAGSLLTAPYAAGNNILTLLAIGIIPLFQEKPWTGMIFIALINLPFLFTSDMLYQQAYYWTATVFLIWATLSWRVYHTERKTTHSYGINNQ